MQWNSAVMAGQTGSTTLNSRGHADSTVSDLLHLGRASAYRDQPSKTALVSPANGVHDLWAEVRRYWLGAKWPA